MIGCGVGLAAAVVAFLIPVRPVEAAAPVSEAVTPEVSEAKA
ncbi:hypothetical protein [Streptomyces sp. GQFP]|nr:hypothetical protein [Streptomyces sp. GQFP]